MWFSIAWSFIVAYGATVIFYQVATIMLHPQQSIAWVLAIIISVSLVIMGIRMMSVENGGQHVATNS